jgi:hypothetical protein
VSAGGDAAGNTLRAPARYSLPETDSKGRTLTPEQREFFKDSKVVDEKGRLLEVYHDTNAKNYINVETGEDWDSLDYIEKDKWESRSDWDKYWKPQDFYTFSKKRARHSIEMPAYFFAAEYDEYHEYGNRTIKAYLNITNPVYNPEIKNAGLTETAGADSMDEYIAQGYDGFIRTDEYGNFSEFGAFYPEQIKLVSNKTPTASPDIRYSLVEGKNDLVAIHNLTEEKLLNILELGGFPMPSIAITKPTIAHNDFGQISVIFDKSAVDPKLSGNTAFPGDAYSPRFPNVDVKINASARSAAYKKIAKLLDGVKLPGNYSDISAIFYEDNIAKDMERGGFAERNKGERALQVAFLKDKGVDFTVPTKEERIKDFPAEFWTELSEAIPADYEYSGYNDAMQYEPVIRGLYKKHFAKMGSAEAANELFDKPLKWSSVAFDVSGTLDGLQKFRRNGIRNIPDAEALNKILNEKVDKAAFKEWLTELSADFVEKKGIRNNTDTFTPTGNHRSFEALHYDYTLQNIVRAMKAEGVNGAEGGFFGGSPSLLAARLMKRFSSIAEMKSRSDVLKMLTEEDNTKIRDTEYAMLSEVTTDLAGERASLSDINAAAEVIGEIADKKLFTAPQILSHLNREYKGIYNFNTEIANKILDLFALLKQHPTTYFEAKPLRAVGFDEVKAVVIPDTSSKRLKDALKENGLPVREYAEGESRQEVISKLDNVRFSLAKPFAEQVDDVLAGKHSQYHDLYVSETPKVLVDLGFEQTPLLMRQAKVKDILDKHSEMTVALIKGVPEAIKRPIFVLESKTNPRESVVMITDIKTDKGEMIVPVWIKQDGVYLDIELNKPISGWTNFVSSAYGRNTKGLLEYAFENDGTLYFGDKKRADSLLTRHGLQLPASLANIDSNTIIRKFRKKSTDLNGNSEYFSKDERFSLKDDAAEITLGPQHKKKFDAAGTSRGRVTAVADWLLLSYKGKAPASGEVRGFAVDGADLSFVPVGADTNTKGKLKLRLIPAVADIIKNGKLTNLTKQGNLIYDRFAYFDTAIKVEQTVYDAKVTIGIRDGGSSSLFAVTRLEERGAAGVVNTIVRTESAAKMSATAAAKPASKPSAPKRGPQARTPKQREFLDKLYKAQDEMLSYVTGRLTGEESITLDDEDIQILKERIRSDVRKTLNATGKPGKTSLAREKARETEAYSRELYDKNAKDYMALVYDTRKVKYIRAVKISRITKLLARIGKLTKSPPAEFGLDPQIIKLGAKLETLIGMNGKFVPDAREKLKVYLETYGQLTQNEGVGNNPVTEYLQSIINGQGFLHDDEIGNLEKILAGFLNAYAEYNRTFVKGARVELRATAVRAANETHRGKLFKNGILGKVFRGTAKPVDVFARMGNYADGSVITDLYEDLSAGMVRRARYKQEAHKIFGEFIKNNKKWAAAAREQTIEFHGVKFSESQLISLYMTVQREQAESHFDGGDIILADEKLAAQKRFRESVNVKYRKNISGILYSEIGEKISAQGKEFMKLVRGYFNDLSADRLKATEMQLWGMTNDYRADYFPMLVAESSLYKSLGLQNDNDGFNVVRPGMVHAVKPGSKKTLVIESAFDVLDRHINQASAFVGLAAPVKAINNILNVRLNPETDKAIAAALVVPVVGKDGTTFRNVLNAKDAGFMDYLNGYLKDLQGNFTETNTAERIAGRLRGWGAKAALYMNPKVWFNQVASLPMARTVGISYKNLFKGLAMSVAGKVDLKAMVENNPLIWERYQEKMALLEGNGIDNQSLLTSIIDFTGKPISMFDRLTLGAIYQASVLQTKGDADAANKLFNKAVAETQPSYNAKDRSAFMRAKGEFAKVFTMFKTQLVQQLSTFTGAVDKYLTLRANGAYGSKLTAAKKQIAAAAGAIAFSTALVVAIAQAFKWLLDKERKDKDGKEISITEDVARDFISSFAGMIPIVSEATNFFLNGFEISGMSYTGINNILNASEELASGIAKLAGGGTQTEISASFRKVALGLSQTFGIPLRNAENYLAGIVKRISPETEYGYRAAFGGSRTYKADFGAALDKGDAKLASAIVHAELINRSDYADDNVVNQIVGLTLKDYSVMPKAVGAELTFDGQSYALDKAAQKAFKKEYGKSEKAVAGLISSETYAGFNDAARAAAIKFIQDYYYAAAVETVLGVPAFTAKQLAAQAIPIADLAVYLAAIDTIAADKDKSGNSVAGSRKSKVVKYVNGLKLSRSQKIALLSAAGYKVNETKAA